MAQSVTKKNTNQVNLLDILYYLLGHWYWFVLCVAVAVSYSYYKYSKTPFTYRSDATAIIKTPGNTQTAASLGQYSNQINRIDMSTEILQLRSRHLMQEVVKRIDRERRQRSG